MRGDLVEGVCVARHDLGVCLFGKPNTLKHDVPGLWARYFAANLVCFLDISWTRALHHVP